MFDGELIDKNKYQAFVFLVSKASLELQWIEPLLNILETTSA